MSKLDLHLQKNNDIFLFDLKTFLSYNKSFKFGYDITFERIPGGGPYTYGVSLYNYTCLLFNKKYYFISDLFYDIWEGLHQREPLLLTIINDLFADNRVVWDENLLWISRGKDLGDLISLPEFPGFKYGRYKLLETDSDIADIIDILE